MSKKTELYRLMEKKREKRFILDELVKLRCYFDYGGNCKSRLINSTSINAIQKKE